jgi:hypothetical protein
MTRYHALRHDEAEETQFNQITDLEPDTVRDTCYDMRTPDTGSAPTLPSDNCITPSTTATTSFSGQEANNHDLEAGSEQEVYHYQPTPPPTYSGSAANPLQYDQLRGVYPGSNVIYAERPYDGTCSDACCRREQREIWTICGVVFFFLSFWVYFGLLGEFDPTPEEILAIQGFKKDCVAHGGTLQTLVDSHGRKEHLWCVGAGAGNETVRLG